MAGNGYDINYDDERFGQVESEKNQALTELEQTYGGMTGEADKYYQAQIDASKQWADKQSQLQQEQTDFTIEQIEQQKEQAKKDYTKEQSGAYADWKKQSNQYGVAAEQQAAAGMTGTGFSESSQVSMYNAYQNRVAAARESYNMAVLNYNNAMKEARLQNNANLAQIAFETLQKQLELSLQGFQYKNQLLLDQANKKIELDNIYHNRYLDVLNQINTENAMAEQIRQYDQNYQLQLKEQQEAIRQYDQNYLLQVKDYEEGIRQFNEEIARLKENDKKAYEMELQNMELKKQQFVEEKRQYEQSYQLQLKNYQESIRQFNEEITRLKENDKKAYAMEIQQLELEKKQFAEEMRQYEQSYQLQLKNYEEGIRQFDQEMARLKDNDKKGHELEIQQLELKKQQLAEEMRQFNLQYELSSSKRSSGGGSGVSNVTAPDAVIEGAPVASAPKVSGHLADAVANGQVVVDADGRLKSTNKADGLDAQMNNLGYGPISTGHLADLMANGDVVIGSDGKLKRTNSSTKRTSGLSGLSKYFK